MWAEGPKKLMNIKGKKAPRSPSRHSARVPSGMDVNAVDLNDLLPAAGVVEVMFTKNDTPHPIAAIIIKKKKSDMILTIKD